MSFNAPSHVSATTGSDHGWSWAPWFRPQAIAASRTTPTLCVLVMNTGPSRNPDSFTHVVPVISPLPFIENHPAMTGSFEDLPRGRIAVTPVRTGPLPTCSGPSPSINVVTPTSTPPTSVMAFSGPVFPSKGTPRSRARGFAACVDASTTSNDTTILVMGGFYRRGESDARCPMGDGRWPAFAKLRRGRLVTGNGELGTANRQLATGYGVQTV